MLINCTWNKLAAEEGVLDTYLHHNFGNFIDTKTSQKKFQSILYTMLKKKKSIIFVSSC